MNMSAALLLSDLVRFQSCHIYFIGPCIARVLWLLGSVSILWLACSPQAVGGSVQGSRAGSAESEQNVSRRGAQVCSNPPIFPPNSQNSSSTNSAEVRASAPTGWSSLFTLPTAEHMSVWFACLSATSAPSLRFKCTQPSLIVALFLACAALLFQLSQHLLRHCYSGHAILKKTNIIVLFPAQCAPFNFFFQAS